MWIYAWINQFFKKKKYTMKYMSGKRTEAIKYALLIKGEQDELVNQTIAEEFAKKSLNRIFSLTLLIQVRQLLIYLMICMIWIFSFCNCSS